MKIGVLTSSRADFGIYNSLLQKFYSDPFFKTELIVFGSHLSKRHGFTINEIINSGFVPAIKIENTYPLGDRPIDIANCMSSVIHNFSKVWLQSDYDLVFVLGDRYEMHAACLSALPFQIKFAHIHGGEMTLGAIDDPLRHSISLMSKIHFTSTEKYRNRVIELIGVDDFVYNVGALSIDNLSKAKIISIEDIYLKYKIDLSIPTILFTFHPETISFDKNISFIKEILLAVAQLKMFQFVVTLPNADTTGLEIKKELIHFCENGMHPNFHIFDNLGSLAYFSFMKHCKLMLGNSSSGFGEASFFPKPVVNLGSRQVGRILTKNIIQCEINSDKIIKAVHCASLLDLSGVESIYGNGNTANSIIKILKEIF